MKNRRTAVLYLMGVFIAGLLAGGFLGFDLGARRWFRRPDPQEMVEHRMGQLEKALDLTADQVRQLRPVLETVGRDAERVHRSTFERIHEAFTNGNRQVEVLLTPEQRSKFAAMQRREEEWFQKACEEGGKGGPRHKPGRP